MELGLTEQELKIELEPPEQNEFEESKHLQIILGAESILDALSEIDREKGTVSLSDGNITLSNWHIDSFDFLYEFIYIKELKDVHKLTLRNVYISQGAKIWPSDALNSLEFISLENISGVGPADVLDELLPLPNIKVISLSGDITSENPLPYTPSLIDLYVVVPDAMYVIKNNTHISGILHMGRVAWSVPSPTWGGGGHDAVATLDGLERFTQLQALSVPRNVRDLSPVRELESLRIIDLIYGDHIDSLMPLQSLDNLQDIMIRQESYNAFDEKEQKIFTPANNRYSDAVHVHFVDIDAHIPMRPTVIEKISQNNALYIQNDVIKSFAFLRDHPEIRHLFIMDSEILTFDYLAEYSTDIVSLFIGRNNTITEELVIPHIPSLQNLSVDSKNFAQLIQHNNHISGYLGIRTGSISDSVNPFESEYVISFEELEKFKSVQELAIRGWGHTFDLSALSGMYNLHTFIPEGMVKSFTPLFELPRLRQIVIDRPMSVYISKDNLLRQEIDEFNVSWYFLRFLFI